MKTNILGINIPNINIPSVNIPIYFKYISKEFLLSFFLCFVFFFFIFFANQILYLAEQILSKKIPLLDVILLLVYFMPNMVSLSFPFASLVSCLMAVSRLSSDNEILSMQSSGISHRQIFLPVLTLGIVFAISSFIINDYFLPAGTIEYNKLLRKLIYANPELEVESFSAKRYLDTVLITGEVKGKNIERQRTDKAKITYPRYSLQTFATLFLMELDASDVEASSTRVKSFTKRLIFSNSASV